MRWRLPLRWWSWCWRELKLIKIKLLQGQCRHSPVKSSSQQRRAGALWWSLSVRPPVSAPASQTASIQRQTFRGNGTGEPFLILCLAGIPTRQTASQYWNIMILNQGKILLSNAVVMLYNWLTRAIQLLHIISGITTYVLFPLKNQKVSDTVVREIGSSIR